MAIKTTKNLEENLNQLKKIVEQMEKNLSLDDALKQFEQGIALVRESQKMLSDAEQKISILLNKEGDAELVPFIEHAS
jgi:exodeoxyribonuclease VII small subunit